MAMENNRDGKPMKVYPGHSEFGTNKRIYACIGEYRCPKKDEFYLSGAIPEVYKAPNDLSMKYHIMQEVEEVPQPPQVKKYRFKT